MTLVFLGFRITIARGGGSGFPPAPLAFLFAWLVVTVIVRVVVVILIVLEIHIVKNHTKNISTHSNNCLFYAGQHSARKSPVLFGRLCLAIGAGFFAGCSREILPSSPFRTLIMTAFQ